VSSHTRLDAPQGDGRDGATPPTDLVHLAKRAAVVWAVGLLIALIVIGVGYAIDVLLIVFAGALFAILLRSLADLLDTRTGMGERWALATAVLLLIGSVAIGAWLLIPSVAEQADELRRTLPKSVEQIEERVRHYDWGRWLLEEAPEPAEMAPRRRDLLSRITGVVSSTLGGLGVLVVILFAGLFFAIQPELYADGLVKLVAIPKRDRVREVMGEVGVALQRWLIAKLAAMVFVGALTWAGLWLLGIGMALALAVLAAVLTFIPNFGPVIAAAPAVLIGLLDGPSTAAWVVGLYVVIQTVESYVVTPLLQQKAVSLPPALTITTQLVMGVLVGGIGVALATPLTVVGLVLIRAFYVQDMLGDDA